MAGTGLGAGMAAAAFWLFVAIVTVAGIWDGIRKRETQHETLRRAMANDKLDPELISKLIALTGGAHNLDRDLTLGGLLVLLTAPGIAILAWFIGRIEPKAFDPLLGVSGLVAFIGIGLLVAASFVRRSHKHDDTPSLK